eukprot:8392277-Alexandrium_andersonii.AAC.1
MKRWNGRLGNHLPEGAVLLGPWRLWPGRIRRCGLGRLVGRGRARDVLEATPNCERPSRGPSDLTFRSWPSRGGCQPPGTPSCSS